MFWGGERRSQRLPALNRCLPIGTLRSCAQITYRNRHCKSLDYLYNALMNKEVIQSIQTKFLQHQPFLNERTRRLWAAAEAQQLGWGGTRTVELATGISHKTIRKGIKELKETTELTPSQSRLPGRGRKKLTELNPDLPEALESLIDPVRRGDPESPLRWTCKSIRRLTSELQHLGYNIGATAVRLILYELDYSRGAGGRTLGFSCVPFRRVVG